jgi:hypothetical protein
MEQQERESKEAVVRISFPVVTRHIYEIEPIGKFTGTILPFYIEGFKGSLTRYQLAPTFYIDGYIVDLEEIFSLTSKKGIIYNG